MEFKNIRKSGRKGVKRRDLEKELPKEKVDLLCNKLKSAGLWQYDEDWPDDQEDQYIITHVKMFDLHCFFQVVLLSIGQYPILDHDSHFGALGRRSSISQL